MREVQFERLVPRPGINLTLYTGVFGAASDWRSEIVPEPPQRKACGALVRGKGEPEPARKGRYLWSELLFRVFGIDSWTCPRCHRRMELRTVVLNSPVALEIVESLERSEARSRGPPDPDSPPFH